MLLRKTEFISCAEKTCSKWYHSKSQYEAAAAVQWSTPKWWKCFQNRWQSTISEARISKIITTVNICHTTTPDFWNFLHLEIQIIKFPSPHIVRECELDELEENFSGVGVEWKKKNKNSSWLYSREYVIVPFVDVSKSITDVRSHPVENIKISRLLSRRSNILWIKLN